MAAQVSRKAATRPHKGSTKAAHWACALCLAAIATLACAAWLAEPEQATETAVELPSEVNLRMLATYPPRPAWCAASNC